MELDFEVNFTFEPGSFLPPSAICTLKSNLLPWMASASSVTVDTDFLFFGCVLGSQTIFLQISWTMVIAYNQLSFCQNGDILFPGILSWGRCPTGSPSRVRLTLPIHCHTREQHFCRKSSYWRNLACRLPARTAQFSLHFRDVCMRLKN